MSLKLNDIERNLLTADPAQWDELLAIIEQNITIEAARKSDEATLSEAFKAIDRSTATGLQSQIKRLIGENLWIGIAPTGLLDSFVAEYTKLIKSVTREQIDKIGLIITKGIRQGRLGKDIAKDIQATTGMCKRRAQQIARAGPLQYSGELTKHHQTSAGIKQYRWQTSHDERVRKSHQIRNDKVFDWNGPGPHPRSEINCRCDAIPLFEL